MLADRYDDDLKSIYAWDDTVPNHAHVEKGDSIVIWNGKELLGASLISENIETNESTKQRYRCPACNKTQVWKRKKSAPLYKWGSSECKVEFENPTIEMISVNQYQTNYSKH